MARIRPDLHDPLEITPELSRKNMIFGLALAGLAFAIFAATIVIAFIYLAVSD